MLAPESSEYWNAYFTDSILNYPLSPQFGLQVRHSRIPSAALRYICRLFLEKNVKSGLYSSWLSNFLRLLPSLEELSLCVVYDANKVDVGNIIKCIVSRKPMVSVHLRFCLNSLYTGSMATYMALF